MKTIIDEARSTERASDRKRLLTRGVVAIAVAGLLVGGGAGVANAATYTGGKTGSASHLTLSGPGVSQVAGQWTVDLSVNAGAGVTVTGTGFDTGASAPAFLPALVPVYYPGSLLTPPTETAPTKAGAYSILGRADKLPSDSGATSTSRTQSVAKWVHDGTQGKVDPGNEAAWSNFSAGNFQVTLPLSSTGANANVRLSGGRYQLLNTRTGVWFTATGGADDIFQVYSTSALGAGAHAANEWVLNLRVVA